MQRDIKTIGFHRIVMKRDSDNFRSSAIIGIIDRIKAMNKDIKIIIYEPLLQGKTFRGCNISADLEVFKSMSDLIIANRKSAELEDVQQKIFTRDIFEDN